MVAIHNMQLKDFDRNLRFRVSIEPIAKFSSNTRDAGRNFLLNSRVYKTGTVAA